MSRKRGQRVPLGRGSRGQNPEGLTLEGVGESAICDGAEVRLFLWYVWFLWALVAFDLLALLLPRGSEFALSGWHAIVLIGGSLSVAARVLRNQFASVLSPLVYLLLLTAIFYGVGVLFYNFGNEASREWVDRHYTVAGSELLFVNLIVSFGLAVTWTVATWCVARPRPMQSGFGEGRLVSSSWWARYYFVIGFGIQYGLVIPYMLGVTSFVLPGAVMLLVNVSYASIFLMSVLFYRSNGREFRVLSPVGLVAGVFAGLVVTSKTWAILSLVFYFIGLYYAKRRLRGLVAGVVVVVITYAALTPFTHFVRNSIGEGGGGSVGDSVAVWGEYVETGGLSSDDDIQWWFLRLSYVSVQAYAIDEFEKGRAGDSLVQGLANVLLPRPLFPEKPVYAPGRQFSEGYGGNPNSSVSPGIYAEGFWNGGWIGVAFVGVFAGIVFGVSHRFVVSSLKNESWGVLPLSVGLFLGVGQVNGFVANVLVYQPIALLVISVVLYRGAMVLGRRRLRFEG